MADDIEFVNGLIVKAPRDGAPDFVKCAISIKVADLSAWLATKEDEWVNIDVKESRGGKWYASVNTYKPKDKAPAQDNATPAPQPHGGDFNDDIPFSPVGRGTALYCV